MSTPSRTTRSTGIVLTRSLIAIAVVTALILTAHKVSETTAAADLETPKDNAKEHRAEMEARITKLQEEVTSLREQLNNLEVNVASVSSDVSAETPMTQKPLNSSLPSRFDNRPTQPQISKRFESDPIGHPVATQDEHFALENAVMATAEGIVTIEGVDCRSTLCRITYDEQGETLFSDNNDLPLALSRELGRDVTLYYEKLGGGRKALYLEIE